MTWKDKVRMKAFRWSPELFARKMLPYNLSKPQKKVLDNLKYKEEDKVIVSAAAGSGKTLAMAIFALWAAIPLAYTFNQGLTINILGGSGEQSRILYRYVKEFIDTNSWIAEWVKGDPLKSESKFKTGSIISAKTASHKQVRGSHPDIAIIDEAVEVDKDLINAVLPRVKPDKFPKRILLSTPHEYDSYFVDLWEKADQFNYTKYQWSKKDVSDQSFVDDNEIEEAKDFYDSATYKQEYLGEPVPITNTVIPTDDLKKSITRLETGPEIENFTVGGCDWGWCVTLDTDILTDDGWKSIDDITKDDNVMTLNPNTKEMEWKKPTNIQYTSEPRETDLITVNHRNFSYSGKKGHELPVSTDNLEDKIKFENYYELPKSPSHRFLRKTGEWEGEDNDFWSNERCKLFGWFIAEGYTEGTRNKIVISQSPDSSFYEDIEALVEDYEDKHDVTTWIKDDRLIVYDRELFNKLKPLGKSHEKYIPKEVKDLPRKKLKLVLESAINGDGDSYFDTPRILYTASKDLADDYQEIAIKCGYKANLSMRDGRKVEIDKGDVYQGRDVYKVSVGTNTNTWIGKQTFEEETKEVRFGTVEVPNHIVLSRRNGKPTFIGNGHPTAFVVTQLNDNYIEVIDARTWKQQKFEWMHNQIESIYDDYEIDIVYADNEDKGENQRLRERGLTLKEVPFTKSMKDTLQKEMRRKFEKGKVLIPSRFKDLVGELKKYTYDTKRNDDLVDALMLSLYGHKKSKFRNKKGSNKMYAMS